MRSSLRTFAFHFVPALGTSLCLLACSSTSGEIPETEIGQAQSALKLAASCDEVTSLLRERLKQNMIESVEAARRSALEQISNGCYDAEYASPSAGGGVTDDAGGSATEYSKTNTQEADVDEADFVKNDGGHIYILAHGQLQIFDAWPADETHRIASIAIEGEPKKLFVHEGRALVYSSLQPADGGAYGDGYYGGGECTYGYDCEFTGDGRPLLMTELDLGDLAAPSIVRTIKLTGSFINARRVGGGVHTVVSFPAPTVEGISTWPEDLDTCSLSNDVGILGELIVNDAFDRLLEKNLDRLAAAPIDVQMPKAETTLYRAGVAETIASTPFEGCENFYLSQTGDGQSFLSVVSTDLGGADFGQATIVGRPGAVYATSESLYVASRHQVGFTSGWFFPDMDATPDATTIHKFALSAGAQPSAYLGSGVVKGRVLNQFALSEHKGYLRVATTTGHLPDPAAHNTVASLKEEGGALVVKAMLDHLAPGEDIRSVRFYGDVGFMVTFKKTDPLFTLDFSQPESPSVRGELKIPGFSTYMHMIDQGHVMSIGYDADDQGDFAWFQGIMLQIFDVTNLDEPRLTHKEVIGTRGSTSDAATNHLAFNFFAPRGLLGLPMVICEGGSGGQHGDTMSFSGLLVYRVDTASGFEKIGGLSHPMATSEDPYATTCGNWWTQSNSYVKRSVFMEDYVYSISEDEIRVAHVDALASPAAIVALTP